MTIIETIAPGLSRDGNGYWIAPEEVDVSFPSDGHDACMAFEESSFWFSHRNRAILAAVRRYPPANGPLFDVGAGNGFVALALQQAGFPTIAIEPHRSGAMNAVSRKVTHVVKGGLPSSAFRAGTAGGIGLFDVIEHVEDDRSFLTSLRPYLKPEGRVYITVPAFPWLWSGNDVRAGHFRRYTLATLRALVEASGFRMEFETYFFSPLPLPILLFRTLGGNNSQARASGQHRLGGSTARRLAERLLAFEAKRIAKGASIPFGGSCLAVATALSDA
jgi:SAM-dependent methyltransferase